VFATERFSLAASPRAFIDAALAGAAFELGARWADAKEEG
jgi:hypothetical protein